MAIDQTQKDKIIAALQQLDHSNPEHWADDGLPRVSVIQKFANDPGIRRNDINETAPGFARILPDTAATESSATEIDVNAKTTTDIPPPAADPAGIGEFPGREEMQAKVNTLEAEHEQNLRDIQDLQRKDQNTMKALLQSRSDLSSKYPRITRAQMTQDYLRSEHQKRLDAARASGTPTYTPGNRADYGHNAGRRVGSPVPYAMGPAGKLVRPLSRLDMARQRGLPSGGVVSR